MLTDEEKRFFCNTALGAKNLSRSKTPQGALVVKGRQIQSFGYSRQVVTKRDYEISAIYDAIFGARDVNLAGAVVFSTYFPSLNDTILIVSMGIPRIYFTGNIEDKSAIDLINHLKDDSIPLEIIKQE